MNSKIITKYIIQNKANLNIAALGEYIKKYKLQFLLPEVLKELNKNINREAEINRTKIVSAHKLDKDNISSLENKYNIKIDNEEIQSELVTGYKLYTKDKIVDASLNTLLKNFIKAN